MINRTTPSFQKIYGNLPEQDRRIADAAYAKYKRDPALVAFEQKFRRPDGRKVFSADLGRGWRALAIVDESFVDWFWLGKHKEYDRLLNRMR